MQLRIKLVRYGRHKLPHYRINVLTALRNIKGNIISNIGWYNPINKQLYIDHHKLFYYINKGAYPTSKVRYLLYKYL